MTSEGTDTSSKIEFSSIITRTDESPRHDVTTAVKVVTSAGETTATSADPNDVSLYYSMKTSAGYPLEMSQGYSTSHPPGDFSVNILLQLYCHQIPNVLFCVGQMQHKAYKK